MKKDILLCGVGGQGTVLASKLLAASGLACGEKVRSAETIGMAQRGGSVTSHVRIGENSTSPLIEPGCADVIIAFEICEAVRNLPYLKKNGTVITSKTTVKPVTSSLSGKNFDSAEMESCLKKNCSNVVAVDAEELCKKFGSEKFLNIILLGTALKADVLGISKETLIEEIKKNVKPQFIDINIKALEEAMK